MADQLHKKFTSAQIVISLAKAI